MELSLGAAAELTSTLAWCPGEVLRGKDGVVPGGGGGGVNLNASLVPGRGLLRCFPGILPLQEILSLLDLQFDYFWIFMQNFRG